MSERQNRTFPVHIFLSYAPEDDDLCQQLEMHLLPLQREGKVATWHRQKMLGGSERSQSIAQHLDSSALILLLVSPHFIASDECYDVEMRRALERHKAGQALAIPIILRHVSWQATALADLPCLPRNGKPVEAWSDHHEALRHIVDELRAIIMDTDYDGPNRTTIGQGDQNRQRFLKHVQASWIDGFLKHSLYSEVSVILDLSERPRAVKNPWHFMMQETDLPDRLLPAGTPVAQVYDEADGALLVLGEPGAGKTTLLLELLRELLRRAEENAQHPLPAFFHLAGWAVKRQPLDAWLVDELHDKYQVPVPVGRSWVEAGQLLPLLDGLDEVAQPYRSACIDTINHYYQEHSAASLVVSSRKEEYLGQAARLSLRKSIVIQPFTERQIDEYVSSAGQQLAGLQAALQNDADLRAMAANPLMLNVLALTYQNATLDSPTDSPALAIRREAVFEKYVARMFTRRRADTRYTQRQATHWLAQLAKGMKRHGQAVFYIEHLQMDWLASLGMCRLYRVGVVFLCVVVGALLGGMAGWLALGKVGGILSVLVFGFAGGLASRIDPDIRSADTFDISLVTLRQRWLGVSLFILLSGIASSLDVRRGSMLFGALAGVLFSTPLGVTLGGLSRVVPDTHRILTPNQGIRRAMFYSLLIMLVYFLFGALYFTEGNRLGLILVGGCTIAGLFGIGGLACIQHFVLRLLLWWQGILPWNVARFLDYGVERILLRKAGGGYIFIHPLLLDYFAGLDDG